MIQGRQGHLAEHSAACCSLRQLQAEAHFYDCPPAQCSTTALRVHAVAHDKAHTRRVSDLCLTCRPAARPAAPSSCQCGCCGAAAPWACKGPLGGPFGTAWPLPLPMPGRSTPFCPACSCGLGEGASWPEGSTAGAPLSSTGFFIWECVACTADARGGASAAAGGSGAAGTYRRCTQDSWRSTNERHLGLGPTCASHKLAVSPRSCHRAVPEARVASHCRQGCRAV